MGRHVNHQDAQDRIMAKFSKTSQQQSLDERDPDSLTIAEQLAIEKKRRAEQEKNAVPVEKKKEVTRFTRYK